MLAAIEAALQQLGAVIGKPQARGRSRYFRRGELRRPMAIREVARSALSATGLDADNAALVEAAARPVWNTPNTAIADGH
jgi:hypothetical protein